MFCANCGKEIEDDSKFCPFCGAAFEPEETKPADTEQEETAAEEPNAEEPNAEEPAAEEPVAEEQAAAEPVAEKQAVTEEKKPEEAAASEEKTASEKTSSQPTGSSLRFCVKCGAKMDTDSRFCPVCGADQQAEGGSAASAPRQTQGSQNAGGQGYQQNGQQNMQGQYQPGGQQYRQQNMQGQYQPGGQQYGQGQYRQSAPHKPMDPKQKKLITIIGSAAAAVLVIFLILHAVIKPTINLDKYITVTYDGYDSIGTATAEFDSDKFEKDYESKLRKNLRKNLGSDKYSEALSWYDSASGALVSEDVSYSLDKADGLSNKDKVKLTWKCKDADVLENYGYKLKYTDKEYTVDGLEEAKKFDPFKGLEVTFSGVAPDGQAQITAVPSIPEADYLNYQIDKADGLSNGDTVTVSLNAYGEDVAASCIQQFGEIPSALSKEYKVDGLGSYITKTSDIPDATLKDMQKQATDEYNAFAVNNYDDGFTLKSMTYLGTYLLTAKSTQNLNGNYNSLYLVYKITTDVDKEGGWFTNAYKGTVDSYWYVEYSNLLLASDKNINYDVTDYQTPSDSFEVNDDYSLSFYGYQSLTALKTAVVTANSDQYNCEEIIDDKASASTTDAASTDDASADGDGEILPDSSTKALTDDDLTDLSADDIRTAINEIYARHGYIFKDDAIREHFEQYDWYEETVKPDDFTNDMLSDTEIANIELLQAKEKELE